jgi:hypothetical protein
MYFLKIEQKIPNMHMNILCSFIKVLVRNDFFVACVKMTKKIT